MGDNRLDLPDHLGDGADGDAPEAEGLVADRRDGCVLITGGAGFIGTNVASRYLAQGRRVRIFDNLSREGVSQNLDWLRQTYGDRLEVQIGDVRDAAAVRQAVKGADLVFHFAAQVAVTTSVADPVSDLRINLEGTFNVLEALRALDAPPPLLFTSTNKVYGSLDDLELREAQSRYEPDDEGFRSTGVGTDHRLDFHSPYGCSKGAADQYVLDYARIYGLKTVVFRMSCIYGPHQFGTEDQGWVAHFLIRALEGRTITLYGDGKQVRDVLFVEDLVDAMQAAMEGIDRTTGRAFNIGGGPRNTTSLLELIEIITAVQGRAPDVSFDSWRPGDQRYYVSDVSRFRLATGWAPRTGVADGVQSLHAWLVATREPVSAATT